MYVRLAFAVAAHLEPDILIVDEVLAVGDADFQKKCLGKMHEASSARGRTILFVSHNMQAVANLCTTALWLEKGQVKQIDTAEAVAASYLTSVQQDKTKQSWDFPEEAPGNNFVRLKNIIVKPRHSGNQNLITIQTPIQLDVEFWNYIDDGTIEVYIRLYTINNECVFDLASQTIEAEKGILGFRSVIPGNLLNNSMYVISFTIVKNNTEKICDFPDCSSFTVEDISQGSHSFGQRPGVIRPQIESYVYYKQPAEKIG